MAYLAPIHQPSSTRNALKLNFLSPDEECLVIAKSNRLEFYLQTEDGLSLAHSKAVYGFITILQKLRPTSAPTDHLFVGTDRFMYFTLSWDAQNRRLHTETTYTDQASKTANESASGDRCHIDPTGSFMTLEVYSGIVTVVPMAKKQRKEGDPEVGSLLEPIPTRIPELSVIDSAFLQIRTRERVDRARIALLYEDTMKSSKNLKVRQITYSGGLGNDVGSVELDNVPCSLDDLDVSASHLVPVSEPAYGLLVLSDENITYYEYSTNTVISHNLPKATIWVAWVQIDSQRYVLGDEFGRLFLLLLIITEQGKVSGWVIDEIGETSRASVLVYLGNGNVFVGSHQGDSQVITIKPKAIDVIQTLPNIAPILDFTIMDMGNLSGEGQVGEFSSGQARLITGSGAYKDGSIRSVRSGVGLEDLGTLDQMENITDLFSLKSCPSSSFVDILVVSFVDVSRVFKFSPDGDVEELEEFCGLNLLNGTLLAKNAPNDRILQVTPMEVRLTDIDSGMVSAEWRPGKDRSITTVTSSDQYVLLADGASHLVLLENRSGNLEFRRERTFESHIACVDFSTSAPSFCTVGFWGSSAVSILSFPETLDTVHTEYASGNKVSVPRRTLLTNVLQNDDPTLFVALADGTIVTYSMSPTTGKLSNKNSIALGSLQAELKALPRGDGLFSVFATCEHPSLIYGAEGRLVYSAITADKASCICPFDAEAYPNSIAIATPNDLKIAQVDEERSTHVRGLHVGENVRRIVHLPQTKVLAMGTVHRALVDNVEIITSHVKITDEVMMDVLATYSLNNDEIIESICRCFLPDFEGKPQERFIVGTAYVDSEDIDAVRGRIIVFEVTQDSTLFIVAEKSVKGACRCLATIDGHIVAALIKTVVIYAISYNTPSTPFLDKLASYRTSTAPIDLSIQGNHIAISDLMKSLSIVSYTAGTAGRPDTLTEVARHYQTAWSTAVATVDEDTYLQADAEGNLLVLKQNVNGVTRDDQRRLQMTSEMRLGEVVNKIRRIDVDVSRRATVFPRAFLATTEGGVYMFGVINPDFQDLLMRLQGQLAMHVQSPGNVPFGVYRGYGSSVRQEGEPFRFVDGELVEQFLDLDVGLQREVVGGAGLAGPGAVAWMEDGDEGMEGDEESEVLARRTEGVRRVVEGLRRLR